MTPNSLMTTAPRHVALLLASLSSLSSPARAWAQDATAQIALRERWRLSVDLGATLALARAEVGEIDAHARAPYATLAVGLGVWRAVHPSLDLGGRLGLRGPDLRDVEFYPTRASCPSGTYPVSFSGSERAVGFTPHALLGARVRPGGPSRPVHLLLGVGASLWVMPASFEARWRCGLPTTPTPTPVGPEVVRRVGGGAGLTLSAVLGVGSHFGPSEEFSIGVESWQHLWGTDAWQYTLGITLGYGSAAPRRCPRARRGAGVPRPWSSGSSAVSSW